MTTADLMTLADGLYVRQAVDNMGWIDLGEYALVVDALDDPGLEDEVFAALRATIGEKPVRYLLNTHTHRDHVSLNDAFRRRLGTEIVNRRTAGIPAEGRWFKGSQLNVLMKPMPPCHTREDSVVWVPGDSVLFTGDIFGWGMIPFMGAVDDRAVRRLTETYNQLISFEAGTVVPGHGPLCSTAELRRWVDYLHWLIERVRAATSARASFQRVMREVPPPDDMKHWWRFTEWKHDHNVRKVLEASKHPG